MTSVNIPYIANRSRWKSFADGQGITNSLENFRGLLTPVNLKETRSHIHTMTHYLIVSRARPLFSRFILWGREKGSGNIVSNEWCSDTFAL